MISGANEQLQQQLEYTLLKPDCHSWWISKMQSDILEERYAIKFCFKLGKNNTGTYGMPPTYFGPSCMNKASVFEWHKRLKEGRESGKSIHQSWLAKRLGLRLLCWGFKIVQLEIPSEETSTLQIGSVAFPPGQFTSPQLHPCQTIWPRWASRQFFPLLIVQTLFPVTFGYSLSSEAVVKRQLRRWKRLWRRSFTRSHKRNSMGPSRSFWNAKTSALLPEEITLKGTRVSCVYYQ